MLASKVHLPVMLDEVLEALGPTDGAVYVDGTFGAGGYTRAVLQRACCSVIGIDCDPAALALGAPLVKEFEGRLSLLEGRFSDMQNLIEQENVNLVDGVMLDVGVSSMQLDQPGRGFSFAKDGPLNMRMDQATSSDDVTAADVVNEFEPDLIATILWKLGEEKRSRRIARAIAAARKSARIDTTGRLAEIVARAIPEGARAKIHPATRTFQALRIYVNRELEELEQGLCAAERALKCGGRLAVVSFHSLEDRIVKSFFKERCGGVGRPSRHMPDTGDTGPAPSFALITRKPAVPGAAEIDANPRSRSAKLRVGQRTSAAAHAFNPATSVVPMIAGARK